MAHEDETKLISVMLVGISIGGIGGIVIRGQQSKRRLAT